MKYKLSVHPLPAPTWRDVPSPPSATVPTYWCAKPWAWMRRAACRSAASSSQCPTGSTSRRTYCYLAGFKAWKDKTWVSENECWKCLLPLQIIFLRVFEEFHWISSYGRTFKSLIKYIQTYKIICLPHNCLDISYIWQNYIYIDIFSF